MNIYVKNFAKEMGALAISTSIDLAFLSGMSKQPLESVVVFSVASYLFGRALTVCCCAPEGTGGSTTDRTARTALSSKNLFWGASCVGAVPVYGALTLASEFTSMPSPFRILGFENVTIKVFSGLFTVAGLYMLEIAHSECCKNTIDDGDQMLPPKPRSDEEDQIDEKSQIEMTSATTGERQGANLIEVAVNV